MASHTRRGTNGANGSNGRGTGRMPRPDTAAVRVRAEQVARSATAIARVADEVAAGAEVQVRSLQEALSDMRQVASSLADTARQTDSVTGSAEGLVNSTNEIADTLFISLPTTRTHIQNILGKFGVSSRTAALASAFRRGLV